MLIPHRLPHWGPGGLSPARKSLLEAATNVWSQNNWREPRIWAVKTRVFLYPSLYPLQTQEAQISNKNEGQRRLRRHQGPSTLSSTHPGGLQGKAPPNTAMAETSLSTWFLWCWRGIQAFVHVKQIYALSLSPNPCHSPPPPGCPEVAL